MPAKPLKNNTCTQYSAVLQLKTILSKKKDVHLQSLFSLTLTLLSISSFILVIRSPCSLSPHPRDINTSAVDQEAIRVEIVITSSLKKSYDALTSLPWPLLLRWLKHGFIRQ